MHMTHISSVYDSFADIVNIGIRVLYGNYGQIDTVIDCFKWFILINLTYEFRKPNDNTTFCWNEFCTSTIRKQK